MPKGSRKQNPSKYGALTLEEIRRECPDLAIWKRVEALSSEDKETFLHPGTWEPGYENLLLGKIYAVHKRVFAAQTVNTWRKEYRDYQRWQMKDPSKAAEDFETELQEHKRKYRTSNFQ